MGWTPRILAASDRRLDRHPLLERLTPPIPELDAEYWLIVHRDVRRGPAVRAVIDWLKAVFAEHRDMLAGIV
jgi:DNA-binding transcriptional LysR family regulator